MRPIVRRLTSGLWLGLLLTAVLAVPADASSIFFLRADNIWVANPDGSAATQITTDGNDVYPYVHVASAKQGATPLVGFLHFTAGGWQYGTMHPDGSAVALNPGMGMAGFTQGDDHDMALDDAGDRMAWGRATNVGHGESFSPDAVSLDGSNPQTNARAVNGIDVTFGDTAGTSLLFDDATEETDYGNADNSANLWPLAPSACLTGTHSSNLVRQIGTANGEGLPAPAAYYCAAGATDLFQPALSPDGQTIAAQAGPAPNTSGDPNFTQGVPRLVVFANAAAASGATPTPLTFLTPDGLSAAFPDFSPDGTEIAFSGPDGVYVVPTAGGAATRILDSASIPAWSPHTLPGAPGGGGTGGGSGGGGTQPGTTPGTPGPPANGSPPKLGSLKLVKHTVHARSGLELSFTVATACSVIVKFARIEHKRVHGHAHTVHVVAGSVTLGARAGRNTLSIKHVHGKPLPTGSYELSIVTKVGTKQSPARTLTLAVEH